METAIIIFHIHKEHRTVDLEVVTIQIQTS